MNFNFFMAVIVAEKAAGEKYPFDPLSMPMGHGPGGKREKGADA